MPALVTLFKCSMLQFLLIPLKYFEYMIQQKITIFLQTER